MANTFKNIQEAVSSAQLARLKKEYGKLKHIDWSKHKDQVKKTTDMLSKLKMGTLIDLYKENIPLLSDIAKSLVLKDKRFAHHVEEVQEADLSKSQVKMVHKKADELPKQDFIKRYGKDGDSVRYATATNIVKKKLGIGEEKKKGKTKKQKDQDWKSDMYAQDTMKIELPEKYKHYPSHLADLEA